ncbi:hypothetical protein [Erwinia amylovora]|uniref:hypothetical protein n=1 Tax=Erwinia amylovora TaxID=552 RepID=UPI001443F682|nr:hypothetical protein [Erwinia amylovora]
MSILTRNPGVPQLRCRSLSGGKSAATFRYEVNVQGRWIPSNYPFAAWVVAMGWLTREKQGEVT